VTIQKPKIQILKSLDESELCRKLVTLQLQLTVHGQVLKSPT